MKIPTRKTVTIIADASHYPQTDIGGFAFFIGYGKRSRIFQSGPLCPCADSNQAEIEAVQRALEYVYRKDLIYDRKIIIWSDNHKALASVDRKRLKNTGATNIRLRYIKGHVAIKTNDCYRIHAWCDKKAREAMRRFRDQFGHTDALIAKLLRESYEQDQ